MTKEQIKLKIKEVLNMINFLRKIKELLRWKQRLEMEILIRVTAREKGLTRKEENIAVAVARCESGLNPKATNKRGNHPSTSTDKGLFQWNDYWHPEITDECAFNPECATRAFCKAIKEGHLSWWKASKSCWEKHL